MTTAIADIATALTSFAACVYCYVLGRRLKSLQNTKDGIGAAVLAFTKSADAMSETTKQTGEQAQIIAKRLTNLLAEAEQTCASVEDLTLDMGRRHKRAANEVTEKQAALEENMQKTLKDYHSQIIALGTVAKELKTALKPQITKKAAFRETPRTSASDKLLQSLTSIEKKVGSK